MQRLLVALAALAAAVFVTVSATANSLFLSSLGRSEVEAALLGAISIASDVAKAILPIVVVRAALTRAWVQMLLAMLLLGGTIVLSVASGLGFTAMARGSVTAAREGAAQKLSSRRAALRGVEKELAALPAARPVTVIEADQQAAELDWRWQASASCAEPKGKDTRPFCAGVLKLRGEHGVATERQRLLEKAEQLRQQIEELQGQFGQVEADPQVAALSGLLGLEGPELRQRLNATIAIVVELGSVVLLLLVAGPALRGWKEPGEVPPAPPVPAEPVKLPVSTDRAYWQRQRAKAAAAAAKGVGGDANDRG